MAIYESLTNRVSLEDICKLAGVDASQFAGYVLILSPDKDSAEDLTPLMITDTFLRGNLFYALGYVIAALGADQATTESHQQTFSHIRECDECQANLRYIAENGDGS